MKHIKVKAVWEFEVDADLWDPEYVDIYGFALELAKEEIKYLLRENELLEDDFKYYVGEIE